MTEPATSEQIGQMFGTGGSFVRRTMAGLRERGWVRSTRGQGGGWTLEVSLSEISLLELYDALGSPPLFAVATSEDTPTCLMEQAANQAVEEALAIAEAAFREQLRGVRVSDLATDFEARKSSLFGGRYHETPK